MIQTCTNNNSFNPNVCVKLKTIKCEIQTYYAYSGVQNLI